MSTTHDVFAAVFPESKYIDGRVAAAASSLPRHAEQVPAGTSRGELATNTKAAAHRRANVRCVFYVKNASF